MTAIRRLGSAALAALAGSGLVAAASPSLSTPRSTATGLLAAAAPASRDSNAGAPEPNDPFYPDQRSLAATQPDAFYAKLPLCDIADVFRFVDNDCRFLAALTPLQPRYAKKVADADSLMAVIIA